MAPSGECPKPGNVNPFLPFHSHPIQRMHILLYVHVVCAVQVILGRRPSSSNVWLLVDSRELFPKRVLPPSEG